MVWQIERTESFDKWWKKENIEESNYEAYKNALQEFKNVTLPHNRQSCLFRNERYECWITRLPDKARRQGKSGGFRVILILDLEENILKLQGIFRRNNLGYKNMSGKYDDALRELIDKLCKEFTDVEI